MSEPQDPAAAAGLAELEDLYENAPCGYLSLSPASRVTRINAALSRWLGAEPGDIIGRHFRDLLTVPGRIIYETNIATTLRLSGEFEEVALDLMTAAGGKLPVLASASERRGDDGALLSVRMALFRAKDRRNYERDLHGRATEALHRLTDEKQAAELREQFIAVLGHDLRNPLASIVGAARLLRREAQSEKGLKVLNLMETSVDRMAGLIDDVMDFARGRLGSGIPIEKIPALLEPTLRQVVDELEAGQPSRLILCEYSAPDPVSFDPVRIGQLASNLLANALSHGDPMAPVHLEATVAEGRMRLSIANAGNPIPPAAMERLFQPFFRGDVRPSKQGLGLGLHIASEIARAHGGELTVSSTEQETRFTFEMPVD